MSLISSFTKQTGTLEPFIKNDGFGKPEYGAPTTIKVREEARKGVVRTATGSDVKVEVYVLTEAEVKLQDRYNGSQIRRVEPIVDKAGKTIGTEFYL